MRTKTQDAARLGIQNDQVAGGIRRQINCGFYPRKPISHGIGQSEVTILAPDVQPHRKARERKNVFVSGGQGQQATSVAIGCLEFCFLYSVGAEFQDSVCPCLAHVHGIISSNDGKRMCQCFCRIGRNPPML